MNNNYSNEVAKLETILLTKDIEWKNKDKIDALLSQTGQKITVLPVCLFTNSRIFVLTAAPNLRTNIELNWEYDIPSHTAKAVFGVLVIQMYYLNRQQFLNDCNYHSILDLVDQLNAENLSYIENSEAAMQDWDTKDTLKKRLGL